jgi:hypothetical protein
MSDMKTGQGESANPPRESASPQYQNTEIRCFGGSVFDIRAWTPKDTGQGGVRDAAETPKSVEPAKRVEIQLDETAFKASDNKEGRV